MLAATLVLLSIVLAVSHIQWPLDDFAEYWAAGRLNAAGANPYDAAAMLREQRQIGWTEPVPVLMYNPPWTFAFATPIGALGFELARSLWLPLQLFLTLWSVSQLWRLYGGAPERAGRAWFIALLWAPTLLALRLGQLTPVVLLGFVGFLWCLTRERDFFAGVFFALTAVKPQLVALAWMPFALWVGFERRWKVLGGVAACVVAGAAAALSTNPRVFTQYVDLMVSTPPTNTFESPNIATVLRILSRTQGSWPQYVPSGLGAAGVALLWYRHRDAWDWPRQLPRLILLSCLLTSYGGWAFDLVILLVPIVALTVVLVQNPRRSLAVIGGAVFLGVSALAFAMHTARVPQAAFLWMTPTVALACWMLTRAAQRDYVRGFDGSANDVRFAPDGITTY